ncbi:MAG: tyrosine-type recombinase/integrase [Firmicutes bacterium]|nr:tyrosine-type recombinase/integrase [Bacillota bacterium]
MNGKDFFLQRNYECARKMNKIILEDLPDFTREFFIGIENATTPLTRLNYAYDLRVFFNFMVKEIPQFAWREIKSISLFDIQALSTTDIEYYLYHLSHYTPPSFDDGEIVSNTERGKSRKLSSLRAFLKYFVRKGKLSHSVAANVATPKIREKEIVRLESAEVSELLNLVEYGEIGSEHQNTYNQAIKLRDLAIFTLFLGTGIRISELVGINIEDLDFKNNAFVVTRKGGNRTKLYFSDEVRLTLLAYNEKRLSDEKIPPSERAFFTSLQNRRIGARAIENIVKKYSRHVAPLKRITPHKLRSTFGTELYQNTSDIYLVADVLGHKDVNTTKKHYAALSDESRRKASVKVVLRDDHDKNDKSEE